jgi:hypothetical protein
MSMGVETLAEIEPFAHTLCLMHAYVPENDERGSIGAADLPFHRPWIEALRPECLVRPTVQPRDPVIKDPVVARAMNTFTPRPLEARP